MEHKKAIATILTTYLLEDKIAKNRRKVWVKDWVLRRQQEGFYAKLLIHLRTDEPELYHNFSRMESEQFDHLLCLVTPHIQKKNTNMRRSISAAERLVLTLRFLATGENYRSLQCLFRIPPSTISIIIPEVLDAIYKVLVDMYLKTPKEADAWEAIADKFNELVQRVFNYRLSRARRIIENVFGIMSARFRVLRKPICLNPEKTIKVTLACCVLHNFLITTNKKRYVPSNAFDHYDANGTLILGDWRTEEAEGKSMFRLQRQRNDTFNAKDIQKEFTEYFIEEGELDFQYSQIIRQ